jgi:hypothetical protein
MTDWQPSETAPRDGTWIEISGEPYHEAKRSTCKAKWEKVETYINGRACYLWCWIAQDGKFGFHCHEWRLISEPLPAPPPLVIDRALDVGPLDLSGSEKAQEDRIGQSNSAGPR